MVYIVGDHEYID